MYIRNILRTDEYMKLLCNITMYFMIPCTCAVNKETKTTASSAPWYLSVRHQLGHPVSNKNSSGDEIANVNFYAVRP